MRLLVVEDELDIAHALAKGLRRERYAVDLAFDGEQGWRLAEVNEYDLLILDLNLPAMDGLEVCCRLRASQPSLLILILTARSRPDQRVLGLDHGADDYLVKPFHFVADVAHELRTPLTSLRTNLEVVSADPEATLGDYRAMAAIQERALTRLEHLVTDLLILATSEHPLSCNTVSLGPLLEEVLCDLKHTAEARMVTLQLTNETEVAVQGDGSLLSRVFSNLVENGIYYNKSGGKVTITVDRKDAWVVVIVSDTGIGIAPEKQAHIFERFYREDSSRARHKGGAGLGLSIVSAIVQQHGGQVRVESTPNAGSIFSVLLPV